MSPRAATRAQLAHIRSLYRALGKEPPDDVHTRAGAYHAIQHAKRLLAHTPPPPPAPDPPTPGQLHDLKVLARRAGEDPPTPPSRGEAARELARLRSSSP